MTIIYIFSKRTFNQLCLISSLFLWTSLIKGQGFDRIRNSGKPKDHIGLDINAKSFSQNPSKGQVMIPLKIQDPEMIYGELYHDVELGQIFSDSKTFADATAKFNPSTILEEYRKAKSEAGFSLLDFVNAHFILPSTFTSTYKSSVENSTHDHISGLWTVLTHDNDKISNKSINVGTLIPLPNSYIVPGGRFREIYYWDSYFTCLGLKEDHQEQRIENMVDNFAYLINKIGHIPNGNRTYYLGRSQPPFFALMVKLLADIKGGEVYKKYLPALEKEYLYWMRGKNLIRKQLFINNRGLGSVAKLDKSHKPSALKVIMLEKEVYLNRYYDELNTPRAESYRQDYNSVIATYSDVASQQKAYRNIRSAAESGWDFSSRWFNGQNDIAKLNTVDLIPVDLNCLLYNLERTLSKAYRLKGSTIMASKYTNLANDRKRAMLKYLWNEEKGVFLDYNFTESKPSPVITLATLFPLFFKIATSTMADSVEGKIQKSFLKAGGLVTTLNTTGEQWDSPNGWAPLQWIGIEGFRNYKKFTMAETIAKRWLRLNDKVFKQSGKMQEKYNVVDTSLVGGGGEYPNQDGFGWTNGVYQKLNALYPAR